MKTTEWSVNLPVIFLIVLFKKKKKKNKPKIVKNAPYNFPELKVTLLKYPVLSEQWSKT